MEDAVDAAHRAAHCAAVEDVAVDGLIREVEVLEVGVGAYGQPQLIAAGDEQTGDARTDEARSTREERLGHPKQSSPDNPMTPVNRGCLRKPREGRPGDPRAAEGLDP